MSKTSVSVTFVLCFLWFSLVSAQDVADGYAPEIATGVSTKAMITADRFMITAANPHAAQAGHCLLYTSPSPRDRG